MKENIKEGEKMKKKKGLRTKRFTQSEISLICSMCGLITFGLSSIFGLILGIKSYRESNDVKVRKQSLYGIIISLLTIFFVLLGVMGEVGENTNNNTDNNIPITQKEEKKIEMIDLNNKSKDEVQKWCDDNKLNCKISEEYSDTIENGKYISQSVNPGEKVNITNEILISFSKGTEPLNANSLMKKIVALIKEKEAYDTGSYIKDDVAADEYAFVRFSGSGSYYSEEDESGSIIDNENFNSFGYVKVLGVGNIETRGVLIKTSAFEKLGVSSAKQIYEILNSKTDYNQAGYYKVGVDIEAGRYIVESLGGSGYYSINSGPVGNSDIVDNDNFNGRASINVSNGQYIEISRAQIIKQ